MNLNVSHLYISMEKKNFSCLFSLTKISFAFRLHSPRKVFSRDFRGEPLSLSLVIPENEVRQMQFSYFFSFFFLNQVKKFTHKLLIISNKKKIIHSELVLGNFFFIHLKHFFFKKKYFFQLKFFLDNYKFNEPSFILYNYISDI